MSVFNNQDRNLKLKVKMKGWKIFQANSNQKKARVAILI